MRIKPIAVALLILSLLNTFAFAADPSDAPPNDANILGQTLLGPGRGEFIFISGGEFTMGHDDADQDDEKPAHLVELSSFYVGRTPVTNSQFVRFLNDARVNQDEYLYAQVRNRQPSVVLTDEKWSCVQGTENDAACAESWSLAQRYCDWLSAKTGRKCRLPTEAEWEYVCRGKEGRMFPWGNDFEDSESKIWIWRTWRSSKPHKVPVGSFPKGATPEGVCDLVGYMNEICFDWYDPDYYAKSPRMDPRGPSKPTDVKRYKHAKKVARGGLHRKYNSKGILGFFRHSRHFGVLPNMYLPRGWSRARCRAVPPGETRFVFGRLGFRVVVDIKETNNPDTNR